MANYERACGEVFEVLKLTPKEQLENIPLDAIRQIKLNAKNYIGNVRLEFDQTGTPVLSHDAQVIILSLYRKYFLVGEYVKCLNKKLQENENNIELKKKNEYNNPNDIFYNVSSQIQKEIKSEQPETSLVVQKNTIFSNIRNFLISLKNKLKR